MVTDLITNEAVMMSRNTILLFFCSVLFPLATQAMPILSADGKILSGVEVEGTSYIVEFADRRIEDLYADLSTSPQWRPIANPPVPGFDLVEPEFLLGLRMGILSALNGLSSAVRGSDLAGCEAHPSVFLIGVQADDCFLYMPDYGFPLGTTENIRWTAIELLLIPGDGSPARLVQNPAHPSLASLDRGDTGNFIQPFVGNVSAVITTVDLLRVDVPLPSTLPLLAMGLLGFSIRRLKR